MTGKLVSLLILASGLIGGAALWYLQIHAFYDEVPASGPEDVRLTARASGVPEPVAHGDFRAIDSDSSPIRYRACFTVSMPRADLAETYVTIEDAVPLVAPGWFDCFDAGAVGAALENGSATAFLGVENIEYGVDRVVAIFEDGRGVAWHRLNRCGEEVFDGKPAPEGCPPPPQGET
ncbi:DUF6446 family protein [Rhodosalinus sp. K401]|uniref:DUF6446 family protein n=1 Tax=Rhodosalinus sp. K401 TaxID=3239195 RepID=UPI003524E524